MTEDEQPAVDRVREMIYSASRIAVRDELMTAIVGTLAPILESFDKRFTELEKSVGLLLQGQALVESSLLDMQPPDEPWRESLDE